MNDIVFTSADFAEDRNFYSGGAGFSPIGSAASPFSGIFDGTGYAIRNIYINIVTVNTGSYVGLFVACSGSVKKRGLKGGSLYAKLKFINSQGYDPTLKYIIYHIAIIFFLLIRTCK